ncbi:MAG: hypothetical protein HYU36_02855 [Planctomycetes bacterium]|nr:hypothetical protein [Planctomycetota bacterium]
MSASNLSHIHPVASMEVDLPNSERPSRSHQSLPECVPSGPILIRVGGRILNLSQKAIRTYLEEYGLNDTVGFRFEECLEHIVNELDEAMKSTPVSVSRRTPAIRIQSRNLIFTLIGSSVVGIRISLKYSSRGKSTEGQSIEPKSKPSKR